MGQKSLDEIAGENRSLGPTRRTVVKGLVLAPASVLTACATFQPYDPTYGPRLSNDFEGHKAIKSLLGIDYDVPVGTPIVAPADGKVWINQGRVIGGTSIWLDHGNGYFSFFAHLSKSLIDDGKEVKRGQLIAYSGASGITPRADHMLPNLHWGVWGNDRWLDPEKLGLNGSKPIYWDEKTPLDLKPEQRVYISDLIADVYSKYKFKEEDPLKLRKLMEEEDISAKLIMIGSIGRTLKRNPDMFEPGIIELYDRSASIMSVYKNIVFSLPFQKAK